MVGCNVYNIKLLKLCKDSDSDIELHNLNQEIMCIKPRL